MSEEKNHEAKKIEHSCSQVLGLKAVSLSSAGAERDRTVATPRLEFDGLMVLAKKLEDLGRRILKRNSTLSDTAPVPALTLVEAVEQALEMLIARLEVRRTCHVISQQEYEHEMKKVKLAYSYLLSKWPAQHGLYRLEAILNLENS